VERPKEGGKASNGAGKTLKKEENKKVTEISFETLSRFLWALEGGGARTNKEEKREIGKKIGGPKERKSVERRETREVVSNSSVGGASKTKDC